MFTHNGVEIGHVITVRNMLTAEPYVREDWQAARLGETEHALHDAGAQVIIILLDECSRPADELEATSAVLDG